MEFDKHFYFLTLMSRDPMDSLFMEQHFLRNSLRLYSNDPLDAENNNASSLFSAAMMEKARTHLQIWGRTGGVQYTPSELQAMFLSTSSAQYLGQRSALGLPTHLWNQTGSAWQTPIHSGLPPGLLGPPNAQRPQITPPPPPQSSTPSSSSGSPSPTTISTSTDLRLPKAFFPTSFHRFNPYMPPLTRQPTVSPRSSN